MPHALRKLLKERSQEKTYRVRDTCSASLTTHKATPIISINDGGIFLKDCVAHSRRMSLLGTCDNAGLHAETLQLHETSKAKATWGYSVQCEQIAFGNGHAWDETHVRPVERLTPARRALMRMASKPRCTSFPSISGWGEMGEMR